MIDTTTLRDIAEYIGNNGMREEQGTINAAANTIEALKMQRDNYKTVADGMQRENEMLKAELEYAVGSRNHWNERAERAEQQLRAVQGDAERWEYVLQRATDLKTSRYETLCWLLGIDVDDFDFKMQIDAAIKAANQNSEEGK